MSDQTSREQQADLIDGMAQWLDMGLNAKLLAALRAGAAALRAPVRPQENEDETKVQSRSGQPQLRAGEADPRGDESGVSLRAAGWIDGGLTDGGEWDCPSRPRLPGVDIEPKRRWWAAWSERAKEKS